MRQTTKLEKSQAKKLNKFEHTVAQKWAIAQTLGVHKSEYFSPKNKTKPGKTYLHSLPIVKLTLAPKCSK